MDKTKKRKGKGKKKIRKERKKERNKRKKRMKEIKKKRKTKKSGAKAEMPARRVSLYRGYFTNEPYNTSGVHYSALACWRSRVRLRRRRL